MNWKVTTPPEFEPISLEQTKEYLRVEHTIDDDIIADLITAATDYCEQELDLAIMEQAITLKMDGFPSSRTFTLPRTNLIEIVSFDYLDASGSSQAFTDYSVDSYSTPARIANKDEWPETSEDLGSVTIVYKAGFGPNLTSVGNPPPQSIIQAMRMLITHWYDNRSAVVVGSINQELALAVEACLHKHRKLGV